MKENHSIGNKEEQVSNQFTKLQSTKESEPEYALKPHPYGGYTWQWEVIAWYHSTKEGIDFYWPLKVARHARRTRRKVGGERRKVKTIVFWEYYFLYCPDFIIKYNIFFESIQSR